MPQSIMVRCFCRMYLVMLYAYPREFRLQFGGEMQQLFRDRCRLTARTPGNLRWLRFFFQSVADWCATTLQERVATMRSMTVQDYGRQSVRIARAVWTAGRTNQPRGFVAEWTMTIVIFLFATTTLVQAYVVPTASMDTTVKVGDHMLVDRMAYANPGSWGAHVLPYHEPKRGDIVVFHYPEDVREAYVKRLVGLPGDRIRLDNKQVIRNGVRLDEPYTQHVDPMLNPFRDNFPAGPTYGVTPRGFDMLQNHVHDGEIVVPPGKLFVMGDNRDDSSDSRYWGFVPREYMIGKPLVVYWSYDAPTDELKDWSLDHVVDVAAHFFTKTRWNRTLMVPK